MFAGESGLSVKVQQFADKVVSFSTFVNDILQVDAAEFRDSGRKTSMHFPCHLCRGMGVVDAPIELIQKGGMEYAPADEAQTCCGFGGTFSAKFPELSEQILTKKMVDFQKTEAEVVVTECPGCIMQLRGGAVQRGEKFEVKHIAEALAENKIG
jgi:Fe-S oxidoreductase